MNAVRRTMAQALVEDRQWDAAISNLDIIVAAEPGNANALQLLGSRAPSISFASTQAG